MRHPSERVCKLWNIGECEIEIHFMSACPLYNNIRKSILEPVFNLTTNVRYRKVITFDEIDTS